MNKFKKLLNKIDENTKLPMKRSIFLGCLIAMTVINIIPSLSIPFLIRESLDSWWGMMITYTVSFALFITSSIFGFFISVRRLRDIFCGKDNFFIYFYFVSYFIISIIIPPFGFLLTTCLIALPTRFNDSEFYDSYLSEALESIASKSFEIYESLKPSSSKSSKSM